MSHAALPLDHPLVIQIAASACELVPVRATIVRLTDDARASGLHDLAEIYFQSAMGLGDSIIAINDIALQLAKGKN